MRYLIVLVVLAAPAAAQPAVPPVTDERQSVDVRLLRAIYALDDPLTRAVLLGADRTFYPVITTAIPVAWTGTWLLDDAPREWRPAYRLTLSQMGTTAIVYVLKSAVGRDRPFAALPDIAVRDAGHRAPRPDFSFPSGHAGISFAIASSVSLSYPQWYVVAPAMGWATAVSLARPWAGVHYPSDVLAGAAIGASVALLVHQLGDAVVPSVLRRDQEIAAHALAVPLLHVRF